MKHKYLNNKKYLTGGKEILFNFNNFFSVYMHGELLANDYFIVPKNTIILLASCCGKSNYGDIEYFKNVHNEILYKRNSSIDISKYILLNGKPYFAYIEGETICNIKLEVGINEMVVNYIANIMNINDTNNSDSKLTVEYFRNNFKFLKSKKEKEFIFTNAKKIYLNKLNYNIYLEKFEYSIYKSDLIYNFFEYEMTFKNILNSSNIFNNIVEKKYDKNNELMFLFKSYFSFVIKYLDKFLITEKINIAINILIYALYICFCNESYDINDIRFNGIKIDKINSIIYDKLIEPIYFSSDNGKKIIDNFVYNEIKFKKITEYVLLNYEYLLTPQTGITEEEHIFNSEYMLNEIIIFCYNMDYIYIYLMCFLCDTNIETNKVSKYLANNKYTSVKNIVNFLQPKNEDINVILFSACQSIVEGEQQCLLQKCLSHHTKGNEKINSAYFKINNSQELLINLYLNLNKIFFKLFFDCLIELREKYDKILSYEINIIKYFNISKNDFINDIEYENFIDFFNMFYRYIESQYDIIHESDIELHTSEQIKYMKLFSAHLIKIITDTFIAVDKINKTNQKTIINSKFKEDNDVLTELFINKYWIQFNKFNFKDKIFLKTHIIEILDTITKQVQ